MQANGGPMATASVAKAAGLPKAHLAKIFQRLARRRILRSGRGVGGGFTLARKAETITLLDVVKAMDGPADPEGCLITHGPCRQRGHCRVAGKLREAERAMDRLLAATTLGELIHPGVPCPKPG